jgi:cation transport ATPase
LLSHSFREFAVEHLAVDAYQQLPALDGFESLGQWGGRATIGGHSVLFGQRAMLDAAGVILPTAPQSAGTQIELIVLQDDLYRGRVVFEYRALPGVEDALGFLKDEGLDLQIVDLGDPAQNVDGRLVVGSHKCHRAALSAALVSVSVLERGKVFVAWPSVTLAGPPVASFLALWREMSTLKRQLKRRLWIALLGFCIAPLALMGWLPIWAAVLWSVAIPSLARLGK